MDVALILDFVDALSRAHNETTCVRAATDFLGRRASLSSLVLAFDGGSRQVEATAVGRRPSSHRGVEASAPLEVEGETGRAQFVFEGPSAPAPEVVAALGRVLAAALRHVGTIARVAEVARRAHLKSRELGEHLREFVPRTIVAASPATRRIFEQVVPIVAQSDSPVLVHGETGTGKELVARRIHELSPRARHPLVRVNCGAIPAGLVESALFGHERGAFTGAVRSAAGFFERAHLGTLFLDEIGELPLAAQVKLLRVLETGEVERVGGPRTLKVDVRIVAATHRDLAAMVESRAFRSDLFYRLDVVSIRVPPLRERVEEIEPLARHMIRELARRFGRSPPALPRDVLRRLRAHPWRGNVRELQNVLERSLLFSPEGTFELDLPKAHEGAGAVRSFESSSRRSIEEALAAAGGRIYGPGGAAELLRLKPTTLASKIKRLGLGRAPRRPSLA